MSDTLSATSQSLEIALNGKRYNISLDMLHHEVRDELRELFKREVEPLTLLKLYITKAQEYATLSQSIEALYKNLESKSLENPAPAKQDVQIEAL